MHIVFLVLIAISCGDSRFGVNSINSIEGKVIPFTGLISSSKTHSLVSTAWASTCEAKASLYALNSIGKKSQDPLLVVDIAADSSFKFPFSPNSSKTVDYIIEVQGNGLPQCEQIYSRPLTGDLQQQNIDYASTLLGFGVNVNLPINFREIDPNRIENLLKALTTSSLYDAYHELETKPELKSDFIDIFGTTPDILKKAPPKIFDQTIHNLMSEKVSKQFKVIALHWDLDYEIAYQWRLDGEYTSNSPAWTFTPSADMGGMHVISLYIGKDDGSGQIDTAYPYYQKDYSVLIADIIPPTPPSFHFSDAYSIATANNLIIETGVNQENCDSFSHMAFTINDAQAPAAFTIACNTNVSQNHSLNLTQEGVNTVRLWTQDSQGKVSLSPSVQTITLDLTNPTGMISLDGSRFKGGTSLAINYTATDTVSGVSSAKLYYAADGSNFIHYIADLSVSENQFDWSLPSTNNPTAKLKLVITDNAGRISEILSSSFEIDTLAPTTPIINLSQDYTKEIIQDFTLSSCNDIEKIFISEDSTTPTNSSSGWIDCQNSFSYTLNNTTDGLKTLNVFGKDDLGNIANFSTHSVTLDRTAPTLNWTSSNLKIVGGGISKVISWELTEANAVSSNEIKIEIFNGSTWQLLQSVSSPLSSYNSYAFSQSINFPDITTTTARLRLSLIDRVGNIGTHETEVFTIDNGKPMMDTFELLYGSVHSGANSVKVTHFKAHDTISKVTHLCFKYLSSSNPTSEDSCWIPVNNPSPGVTPAQNIEFLDDRNYYVQVGFTPFTYNVYAWIKDEAGNVSNQSMIQGKDKYEFTFTPGAPPVVTDLFASNTSSPNYPPTISETLLDPNDDVYLTWKITDDDPIPDGTIKLSWYDQATKTWLSVTEDPLNNGVNGACSLTSGATGCYLWQNGSPTNAYFRLKLEVTDAAGMVTFSTSNILNIDRFRVLAGKTDIGTGGSASSGIFINTSAGTTSPDTKSFVIRPDGTLFFLDYTQGLLKVDPQDGLLNVYIPKGASITGNNGPAHLATLKKPVSIALDHQNRVLIWDDTQIRRIDNDGIIRPLIGSQAGNISLSSPSRGHFNPFFVLPNGDIYFQADSFSSSIENGAKITVYHSSTDSFSTIIPSGTATINGSSTDIQTVSTFRGFALAYDPTSSAIQSGIFTIGSDNLGARLNVNPETWVTTSPHPDGSTTYYVAKIQGMDGQIYLLSKVSGTISRYNPATKNSQVLIGNGFGNCEDGTAPLQCAISVDDVFVTAQGKIYFVDAGRIRTIGDDGNILTIFGQSYNFGDGGLANSARFNEIFSFSLWGTGVNKQITLFDFMEARIREFTINGIIQTIAGNGRNGSTSMAGTKISTELPLFTSSAGKFRNRMAVDTTSGEVYMHAGANYIMKLERDTPEAGDNTWTQYFGSTSGTNYYYDSASSNKDINLINTSAYYPSAVIGFGGNKLLINHYSYNTTEKKTYRDTMTMIDTNTSKFYYFAGDPDYFGSGSYCAVGTPLNTCKVTNQNYAPISQHITGNTWYVMNSGTATVYEMTLDGNMLLKRTLPRSSYNFVFRKVDDVEYFYYCSAGKLYKHGVNVVTPALSPGESALNIGIDSITCSTGELRYDEDRDSLIFVFSENGLQAIGEYLSP